MSPRRLGSVVKSRMSLNGDVVRVADLEGQDFVIRKVQEWEGKNGAYMAVQIEHGGQNKFFFSSHTVIMRKLREAAEVIEQEPLLAKIVRVEADNPQGFFYDIQ